MITYYMYIYIIQNIIRCSYVTQMIFIVRTNKISFFMYFLFWQQCKMCSAFGSEIGLMYRKYFMICRYFIQGPLSSTVNLQSSRGPLLHFFFYYKRITRCYIIINIDIDKMLIYSFGGLGFMCAKYDYDYMISAHISNLIGAFRQKNMLFVIII